MLVSQLVSRNIENKGIMTLMTGWQDDRMTVTDWPDDWVNKWPSDQVTEWPSDRVTKWPSDQVTGSFADDWPYGIFHYWWDNPNMHNYIKHPTCCLCRDAVCWTFNCSVCSSQHRLSCRHVLNWISTQVTQVTRDITSCNCNILLITFLRTFFEF